MGRATSSRAAAEVVALRLQVLVRQCGKHHDKMSLGTIQRSCPSDAELLSNSGFAGTRCVNTCPARRCIQATMGARGCLDAQSMLPEQRSWSAE